MPTVTFKISGGEELQDKLNRLPVEFSKRALRKGLRPPGQVFKKAIQAGARITGKYATGWMAKHIIVRTKTNDLDEGSVKVTFDRKQRTADGKKTNTSAIYEALYAEFGFAHKGGAVPARPFIRPAFESTKGEAVESFVSTLRGLLSDVFR
jgi:HK97 gp10 family phage protein